MSADCSFDPRTGLPAASVAHTSEADLEEILIRADAAAMALRYSAPADRRTWLYAVAEALDAQAEELIGLADWETALGVARLRGEVARTAGQIRFYAEVAADGGYLGATIDQPTATTPALGRMNLPLGPVAVFGASNFPLAFSVFGNDTASAIAAGCSVVVKAHPAHPAVSQRVFEIAERALRAAGAPPGVLGIVFGFEAGVQLVEHRLITAVAFTGSQAGGLALWRRANERPVVIPVYAEMGTVNPVVVTRAAATAMSSIAAGFVGSFTLGHGQFCTKPGMIFVPRGSGAAEAVAGALAQVSPRSTMLTRDISVGVPAGIAALQDAGATVVAQLPASGSGWSAPAVVLTAPLSALRPGSALLEEVFGPVAVVVEYDRLEDVLTAVDQLQGALAASLMIAEEDPDARTLLDRLQQRVGRVVVNDWPTGVAFTWAQQHGGPWPATTSPATTSVGAAALDRFTRPVAFQGVPDELLPPPLRTANPWQVPRRVIGSPALVGAEA